MIIQIINFFRFNSYRNMDSIKMLKRKVNKENKQNEIYISRKRKGKNIVKFYYNRALELFNNKNYNEIYICGIGACVNEAIKVALFIIEAIPSVEQSNIITDTISHFDEYINEETNERIGVKEDRRSNIIKIKLIKK